MSSARLGWLSAPVVALDMDEVLYPFAAGYAAWLRAQGLPTYEPWACEPVDAAVLAGVPFEVALTQQAEFAASDFGLSMEPVPGAAEALRELGRVADVHIVTARTRPAFQDATHDWLDTHLPNLVQDVHFLHEAFTVGGPTKAEVCRAIGARVMVDDTASHLRLVASAGIVPVLFGSSPWSAPFRHVLSWAPDWPTATRLVRAVLRPGPRWATAA